MIRHSGVISFCVATVFFHALSGQAVASFHFWDINEVYSNADGTIQFIELTTTFDGQEFLSEISFTSNGNTFRVPDLDGIPIGTLCMGSCQRIDHSGLGFGMGEFQFGEIF